MVKVSEGDGDSMEENVRFEQIVLKLVFQVGREAG